MGILGTLVDPGAPFRKLPKKALSRELERASFRPFSLDVDLLFIGRDS